MKDESLAFLTLLEDLLVREFRACQSILDLTRDERRALALNNPSILSTITEEKEVLLDDLAQTEDRRRMVIQALAQKLGRPEAAASIAGLAQALPPGEGERLGRLREGILALSGEIRELTSGNRALARLALERVDAVQTFLLDLARPTLFYGPPGAPGRPEPETTWGLDVGM